MGAVKPKGGSLVTLRTERRREERYIPIDLIDTDGMARPPRARRIEAIAASIADEGLSEPVEVTPRGDRYQLTHGWVRLEACRRVGDTDIAALIWCGPASKRKQRAGDANLLQDGLTALDRALYLAAAKATYELADGESQVETLTPYWRVAIERYGLSRATVFRALALGAVIAGEAARLLADTDWADNQSALEQISRFSPDQQVEIARLITAEPARTLAEALAAVAGVAPSDPHKKAWSAATGGWSRLGAHQRREWLRGIAGDLPTGVRIVFDEPTS